MRDRKPKSTRDTVVVGVYLERDLLKQIDTRAHELGWPRSQYLRRAAIRALEAKDER